MKSTKLLVFILLPFFLFSQEKEKRLALVIGNANYDKGELKNPVNDARLIASTLDSLNFDVILKENIETRSSFIRAVREFGTKRPDYDVAIVYYAGHGIQVDDENFLLPTKEEFFSEEDVLDFALSVQNIMRYLKSQTNQVNILILDACRDNPFESTWKSTRSLKGEGLAKIPPPTGSLIAFSTDSGQTAPDGDGENSVYSISLSKNMLKEDTSIDQVFRNVRAEVLDQTNNVQRPVEATQLTGQGFFLNSRDYRKFIILAANELSKSTSHDNSYSYNALEILNSIIPYYSTPKTFDLIGDTYESLGEKDKAIEYWLKAVEKAPSPSYVFSEIRPRSIWTKSSGFWGDGDYSYTFSNYDTYEKIAECYKYKAFVKAGEKLSYDPEYLRKAEEYIHKTLEIVYSNQELNLNYTSSAYNLYSLYRNFPDLHNKALAELERIIYRYPDDKYLYQLRGVLHYIYIDSPDSFLNALPDLIIASNGKEKSETVYDVYDKIGIIYRDYYKDYDKAIDFFTKQINNYIATSSEWAATKTYRNRGFVYLNKNDFQNAMADFNKAVEMTKSKYIDFKNAKWSGTDKEETLRSYLARIAYFMRIGDLESAINDAQTTIEIDPTGPTPYYVLANIYNDSKLINNSKFKALNNILLAISYLKPQYIEGMPKKGYVKGAIRKTKYVYNYQKYDFPYGSTSYYLDNTINLGGLYEFRASIYKDLGEYKLACEDYYKAIDLNYNKNEKIRIKSETKIKKLILENCSKDK